MNRHVHNKDLFLVRATYIGFVYAVIRSGSFPYPKTTARTEAKIWPSASYKTSRHHSAQATPVMPTSTEFTPVVPASTESEFALGQFHFVLLIHGVLHRSPMHRTVIIQSHMDNQKSIQNIRKTKFLSQAKLEPIWRHVKN
jgi:hypothetical protein